MKLRNPTRSETSHFIGGVILAIILVPGISSLIAQITSTRQDADTVSYEPLWIDVSSQVIQGAPLNIEKSPLLNSLSHGIFKDYDPKTKSVAQYRAIRVDDKGYVICSKK